METRRTLYPGGFTAMKLKLTNGSIVRVTSLQYHHGKIIAYCGRRYYGTLSPSKIEQIIFNVCEIPT